MEIEKFILIVAIGRSGSTTLQRILNTIPNSNITGENENAIINLLMCYQNLKKTLTYNCMSESIDICINNHIKPAWYNSFDILKIKKEIQKLIINILSNNENNRVLGFKEIRYYKCINLLDIFIELFPNTKIICHYREDINKLLKSGWWKMKDKADIIKYTNEIKLYYNKHKDYCYLSTMEKMLIPDNIKKMFTFLEEPFDIDKYNLICNNSLE
jgi:hypothetical protein